jgi:ornithine decarboxylase
MQHQTGLWQTPQSHLARTRPDHPVLYLSPSVLQANARRFQQGFPGLVSYAVKANHRAEVLDNLVAAGIGAFDVASPAEMVAVRKAHRDAVLHYNNPVRSPVEVAAAIRHDVASWSVDDASELAKLHSVPTGSEVSVRFTLPVTGAAYDFGEKFGASPDQAVDLLKLVVKTGYRPALCFHPGTQCEDKSAWLHYIREAAGISQRAGVRIARLNVGGGFAADRTGTPPDLEAVFQAIGRSVRENFGPRTPALICEPGRAMVSEGFVLAARVKALRAGGGTVFLNDGIYGGLTDLRDMGLTRRVRVVDPDGRARDGDATPRTVFGPTCDSLDRLPGMLGLPGDMRVGDYVLFDGLGAYSVAMSTAFNGYGLRDIVTVR